MKIEAGLQDLNRVVECIKKRGKNIVLLKGPVGAGKTTLVKAFANSLGKDGVSSPTFSIQQVYGENIYHYDMYNAGFEKFMELGLFEELEYPGFHFIEWADEKLKKLLDEYGFEFLEIEIIPKKNQREYRCIDS